MGKEKEVKKIPQIPTMAQAKARKEYVLRGLAKQKAKNDKTPAGA